MTKKKEEEHYVAYELMAVVFVLLIIVVIGCFWAYWQQNDRIAELERGVMINEQWIDCSEDKLTGYEEVCTKETVERSEWAFDSSECYFKCEAKLHRFWIDNEKVICYNNNPLARSYGVEDFDCCQTEEYKRKRFTGEQIEWDDCKSWSIYHNGTANELNKATSECEQKCLRPPVITVNETVEVCTWQKVKP